MPGACLLKVAKTLGKRADGRGKTLREIRQKCSSAGEAATIVSICFSRIAARDGHEKSGESILDDLCAYLSMCIPATDIREHSEIGARRREGLSLPPMRGMVLALVAEQG